MAILDNIINFGNSTAISGLSNLAQLADFSSDLVDLSNGKQLQEIVKEFKFQNEKYLTTLSKYSEKLIFQFEKSLENDKIIINQNEEIIKQNEQIINLLSGGK